ncbi:endospore germination permease [Proteinivorax hydrogeniformans]|uniref:Endospore germination permease n=1 Tax=Proteinivorax hydrogeniformans TaxID=1826727 RepID=A0AAU8HQN7_9FIRM
MEGVKRKEVVSYWQLFLLTIAQLGGASIIYLPGVFQAGKDVWISNLIASLMAYIVIFLHYLPMSLNPDSSMTSVINKYWGRCIGGIVNFYYFAFHFLLCCLILSDTYFFGKMTMPETPAYVFSVFLLVPIVYAIKQGIEVIARLLEIIIPFIFIMYILLFLLVIPQLEITKLLPVMGDGIMPVLEGALPNLNFPYAQILPIAFLYRTTTENKKRGSNFIKTSFLAILMATLLLTVRSLASAAAFDEETLVALTYPPFSTIRLLQVGDVIERLDSLMLATFYGTTFFKFLITFYIATEIISEYFKAGSPKEFALPLAVLIGVSMPFILPRLDLVLDTVIPYFWISLPLFVPVPLLLYLTILIKGGDS